MNLEEPYLRWPPRMRWPLRAESKATTSCVQPHFQIGIVRSKVNQKKKKMIPIASKEGFVQEITWLNKQN